MDFIAALLRAANDDRHGPFYWTVLAILVLRSLPTVVKSLLQVGRLLQLPAVGRKIVHVALRGSSAVKAAFHIPDPRVHRPVQAMTLDLALCTLDYLVGIFAVLASSLAPTWLLLHGLPTTGAQILGLGMLVVITSLGARLFLEQGRRQRVALRERWLLLEGLEGRRGIAGLALAMVPVSMVSLAAATAFIR